MADPAIEPESGERWQVLHERLWAVHLLALQDIRDLVDRLTVTNRTPRSWRDLVDYWARKAGLMPPRKPSPAHQQIDRTLEHVIRDVHRLQAEVLVTTQMILEKIETLAANTTQLAKLTNRLNAKSAAIEAAIQGDADAQSHSRESRRCRHED